VKILQYLLQTTCVHELTWPFTIKGETYQRCTICGAKIPGIHPTERKLNFVRRDGKPEEK
jgi:hypothetical protein